MHTLQPEARSHEALVALPGIDPQLIRAKPLVAAIAREITEAYGGNEVLNWLEAEILLEDALDKL